MEMENLNNGNARPCWSERSACAARPALQTGCVANVVATEFIVFVHFAHTRRQTPHTRREIANTRRFFYALLLFSQKGLS
jgi:hypothetical protein